MRPANQRFASGARSAPQRLAAVDRREPLGDDQALAHPDQDHLPHAGTAVAVAARAAGPGWDPDGTGVHAGPAQVEASLYGNSKDEAIYPVYFNDADHQPITGANRYTLRFAPGQLPPVNAFWSLTLYQLPSSLLYANPLDRYLINSPMLPALKQDTDGGITLYLQNASPGADKESNWLPAPTGPFFAALRLYWPKPDALEGKWKAPALERAK